MPITHSPATTLDQLRVEFDRTGRRTLAFPIAGTLAWIASLGFGLVWDDEAASFAMLVSNGLIFPVSLLLARLLGETVLGSQTELDKLFGRGIIMIQLVWAIAIPFWLVMPDSLPLSIGVMAGLHWLLYGWIVQHWIGMFQAVTRALLVVLAWFAFPDLRFVAIPMMVIVVYLVTIYVLATRPLRA